MAVWMLTQDEALATSGRRNPELLSRCSWRTTSRHGSWSCSCANSMKPHHGRSRPPPADAYPELLPKQGGLTETVSLNRALLGVAATGVLWCRQLATRPALAVRQLIQPSEIEYAKDGQDQAPLKTVSRRHLRCRELVLSSNPSYNGPNDKAEDQPAYHVRVALGFLLAVVVAIPLGFFRHVTLDAQGV